MNTTPISFSQQTIENLIKKLSGLTPTLIEAVIVFIIGLILSKLVLMCINRISKNSKSDKTILRFVNSFAKGALTVLVIIATVSALGFDTTGILTVVGTAGLAIGLALQNSLSNIAGGFLLLINKPFKVGDYIQTNDEQGTVEAITLFCTKIRTVDNKNIVIPNSAVVGAKIVNFTDEECRRVDIEFNISYSSDFRKAEEIILDVCKKHPLVLDTPAAPFARLLKQGESSLVIIMRAYTKSSDYWDVFFDINEQVKLAFDENHIEIPYNKLDVNIRKEQ